MAKQSEWLKWIPIIIAVVSLVTGAVVWANSEHTDIKAWTTQKNYVTTKDLEKSFEKQYVPKEDFSRIEQSIKDQKDDIKEIKEKLDKILDMVHKKTPD